MVSRFDHMKDCFEGTYSNMFNAAPRSKLEYEMGFFFGIPPGPSTTAEVVAGAMTKNVQSDQTKRQENMGPIKEKGEGEGEWKGREGMVVREMAERRIGEMSRECPKRRVHYFFHSIFVELWDSNWEKILSGHKLPNSAPNFSQKYEFSLVRITTSEIDRVATGAVQKARVCRFSNSFLEHFYKFS